MVVGTSGGLTGKVDVFAQLKSQIAWDGLHYHTTPYTKAVFCGSMCSREASTPMMSLNYVVHLDLAFLSDSALLAFRYIPTTCCS